MLNINQQILIEKSSFICRNSTFFHRHIHNIQILNALKNILLEHAPLTECSDYEDLLEEIKNSKTKNQRNLSYYYSFETLFAIVDYIRTRYIYLDEQEKNAQIETLRLYVRHISSQSRGKMYYSEQQIIKLDKDKIRFVMEENKRLIKEKKDLHS